MLGVFYGIGEGVILTLRCGGDGRGGEKEGSLNLKLKGALISSSYFFLCMRSSRVVAASECQCQSCATVLRSIPASSGTVESEGRQMKQCWIEYTKNSKKS